MDHVPERQRSITWVAGFRLAAWAALHTIRYGLLMDLKSPRLSVPLYILTALFTFAIFYWITDFGLIFSVVLAAIMTGITVWGRQRGLQR